ncbi:MAG: hypothetical protein HOE62_10950 [Alphaproteobacteria bacterium]|jgi:hypothetical protein|nr:hypothetical protein [Alphaproteobacteria bacterium]MBT7747333.1 hypothetical protein [Alphaproteobacteria bacterium]
MYEINPEFLNADGSVNYDNALQAGRKTQAIEVWKVAIDLWAVIKGGTNQLLVTISAFSSKRTA